MTRSSVLDTTTELSSRPRPAARRRELRIALLGHGLRVAGGRTVGQSLVAALGRVAPRHAWLLTVPPEWDVGAACGQMPCCEPVVYRTGGLLERLRYDTATLPRLVRRFRPDVVLALGNFGLLDPPCPQAILLHQAYLLYPPKHYGRAPSLWHRVARDLKWLALKQYFGRQLHRTSLVLCQTPVMERRLRGAFGYRGRAALCPNAISPLLAEGDIEPPCPEPLRPFAHRMKLLCLTRYYSHKNLEAVVETFHAHRRELEGVVAVLTVAADQHPGAPALLRSVEQLGLGDAVINVGPLPQGELAAYCRHCQAMLLPTLMESFSGTYLEAMHFGLPILTSGLDFAEAVCGDAALYFDPWETGSIAKTILRLRDGPALAEELVAKGWARLEAFPGSWDAIAGDVAALLADLADADGSDTGG